ncbi:MAG: hypothetical protein Q8941_00315 [Bacteroidota bacterium]|nr:hypothetical protein [Bacteroidota bacterium]
MQIHSPGYSRSKRQGISFVDSLHSLLPGMGFLVIWGSFFMLTVSGGGSIYCEM